MTLMILVVTERVCVAYLNGTLCDLPFAFQVIRSGDQGTWHAICPKVFLPLAKAKGIATRSKDATRGSWPKQFALSSETWRSQGAQAIDEAKRRSQDLSRSAPTTPYAMRLRFMSTLRAVEHIPR